MKRILVTGASGQLGQCIKKVSAGYSGLEFTFASSEDVDLTLFGVVSAFFRKHKFDYCINCAAYTNVEKAESDVEMAYLVNAEAVQNLAKICEEEQCTLIHISTDYVFNGRKETPYSESDPTDPINVYGASKLLGEEYIQRALERYFIIRTSWLYSDIGHNFFNTIRKKASSGETLNLTTTQKGTPTNAYDLADLIIRLIESGSEKFGIYHYSNLGQATWFDFAAEILAQMGSHAELVKNDEYKTIAERPAFSVMDKNKVMDELGFSVPEWKESLAQLIKTLG